jgi:hypothetical protein
MSTMPSPGEIASVVIVALSFAFIGWAMVHIASRMGQ